MRDDQRGVVLLEFLVVFMPLVLIFVGVWQVCELYAAKLVVSRACTAAGRAAAVVLPDNPSLYQDEPPDMFDGAPTRKSDIEFAVVTILAASPHFKKDFQLKIENIPQAEFGTIDVKLVAQLDCRGLRMLCPLKDVMELTAESQHEYHGAAYEMEPVTLNPNWNSSSGSSRPRGGCTSGGTGGTGGTGGASGGGGGATGNGGRGGRGGGGGTANGGSSGAGGSGGSGGSGGAWTPCNGSSSSTPPPPFVSPTMVQATLARAAAPGPGNVPCQCTSLLNTAVNNCTDPAVAGSNVNNWTCTAPPRWNNQMRYGWNWYWSGQCLTRVEAYLNANCSTSAGQGAQIPGWRTSANANIHDCGNATSVMGNTQGRWTWWRNHINNRHIRQFLNGQPQIPMPADQRNYACESAWVGGDASAVLNQVLAAIPQAQFTAWLRGVTPRLTINLPINAVVSGTPLIRQRQGAMNAIIAPDRIVVGFQRTPDGQGWVLASAYPSHASCVN